MCSSVVSTVCTVKSIPLWLRTFGMLMNMREQYVPTRCFVDNELCGVR